MKKFTGNKWEVEYIRSIDLFSITAYSDKYKFGDYEDVGILKYAKKEDARLIAAAPEMYDLLDNISFYITEVDKLCSSAQIPFFSEFVDYANRIKYLLTRIDGTEDENE